MKQSPYIIDLETYKTRGSKVFTGRPRGVEVRKATKIDDIETNCLNVVIKVPNSIASINPSFFEEFLVNVVSKLGEQGFREKFSFENPGEYKIDDDLTDAIERILREENALAQ
ncbi:MAG TPA: DUF4325 domain-containing protein [Bacteroidia bacterium]|nr:DUF4325 domain-containing protein [Bacteroidia bacterium]